VVFSLEPAGELPFHFVTVDGPCISLVRVRRLKYPGYTVEEIGESCKKDIAALRSISVTEEIFRELRARGPDRHWYRYLVLPGSVEVLEDREETDKASPVKPNDAVEPVKDTGTGDTMVTRLRPVDIAEPDDPAGGDDTGNRSGSLPVTSVGGGTPGCQKGGACLPSSDT